MGEKDTDRHLNIPPVFEAVRVRDELDARLAPDAGDAVVPDVAGGGGGVVDGRHVQAVLEVEGEEFDYGHRLCLFGRLGTYICICI